MDWCPYFRCDSRVRGNCASNLTDLIYFTIVKMYNIVRVYLNEGREVKLDTNKVKRQLIIGCIPLGIFIISGSIQVIFSPFSFVRIVSVIGIIISSACIGAAIRGLFLLKAKNRVTK